jgi:hypothetical protein
VVLLWLESQSPKFWFTFGMPPQQGQYPRKSVTCASKGSRAFVMAAEPKIMRQVVRTARESQFIHFYLACGHMITLQENPTEKAASSIECWACEEESKKGLSPK